MTTKQKDCLNTLGSLALNNTLSSMQICLLMIDCVFETFGQKVTYDLVYEIVKNQSSMAAVINTGLKILKALEHKSISELEHIKNELINSSQKAIENAADFLSGVGNIATISFSQSVFEVLEIIKPQKVFLSVAHPAKEGENLAKLLIERNIKPVLFEDSAYSLVLRNADAVVVGADAIFDDSFVNKTGTLQLALLSEYFNMPFYVVGCSCKYLDKDARKFFKIARKPAKEISSLNCERINVYFEEISNRFVNKMFVR